MLSQVIPRTVFNNALVAALFGGLVPYLKGFEFLDVMLLLAYALLSLFFVAPMAVDSVFATEDRRIPLRGLARAALAGWAGGLAVTWIGIATVSWKAGRVLTPPAAVALSLAVLSLLGCVFVSALAAMIAKRALNREAAKSRLRIGFLLLLVAILGVPRLLSDDVNAWLLGALTPEGLVKLAMLTAPVAAIATVGILARVSAR
jgi:hypothetical protein